MLPSLLRDAICIYSLHTLNTAFMIASLQSSLFHSYGALAGRALCALGLHVFDHAAPYARCRRCGISYWAHARRQHPLEAGSTVYGFGPTRRGHR